jgi:DNA-directed RNA polymerase beta subunit
MAREARSKSKSKDGAGVDGGEGKGSWPGSGGGGVGHHLDSYDDFVSTRIPGVIAAENESFVMMKAKNLSRGIAADFRFTVSVRNPRVCRPTVSLEGRPFARVVPNLARAARSDYSFLLVADVEVEGACPEMGSESSTVFREVALGEVPIMLRSSVCALRGAGRDGRARAGEDPDDEGGYFVVGGAEKAIVSHLDSAPNRPTLAEDPAATPQWADRPAVTLTVDSAPENSSSIRTLITARPLGPGRAPHYALRVGFKPLAGPVGLATVFRALGFGSDRAIAEAVVGKPEGDWGAADSAVFARLRPSLLPSARGEAPGAQDPMTWSDAIDAVGAATPYGIRERRIADASRYGSDEKVRLRGRAHASYLLCRNLLAAYGDSLHAKGLELGRLARSLLESLPPGSVPGQGGEEGDALVGKTLSTAGKMLGDVFEEAYVVFKREALSALDRAFFSSGIGATGDTAGLLTDDTAGAVFDPSHVTSVMRASFTGNWGMHKGGLYTSTRAESETGIVQDLERKSFANAVSVMRKVNKLSRSGGGSSSVRERRQSGSSFGYLCPAECPDGENVGFHSYLSHEAGVTVACPGLRRALVDGLLRSPGAYSDASLCLPGPGMVPVYVDGVLECYSARRPGLSVAGVAADVRSRVAGLEETASAAGLPLPRAQVSPWASLGLVDARVSAGRLVARYLLPGPGGRSVYLDPEGAESGAVVGATHLPPYPGSFLGSSALAVPFLEHNQSVRGMYAIQQGKHAASVYSSAFRSRPDRYVYVLGTPQAPLVATERSAYGAVSRHPQGQNLACAVMPFRGMNQEDAVVLSRDAVDSGALSITVFETLEVAEEVQVDGSGRPTGAGVRFDRRSPAEAGTWPPAAGQVLRAETLIAAMVRTEAKEGRGPVARTPSPVLAGSAHAGKTVEARYVVHVKGRGRVLYVRLRHTRPPAVGDKVSSRAAQKGIVAAIVPPEDMPFDAEGVSPCLLINPLAFPKRMTVAQFMETRCALGAASRGVAWDATPFKAGRPGVPEEAAEDTALSSGETGARFSELVAAGPCYYQRLKQMVRDKVSARARGTVSAATLQPVKGRARGGGLRLGEMEMPALLAHGLAGFQRESAVGKSDGVRANVDRRGNLATPGDTGTGISVAAEPLRRRPRAPSVATSLPHDHEVTPTEVPASAVHLYHLLAAGGIGVSLGTARSDRDPLGNPPAPGRSAAAPRAPPGEEPPPETGPAADFHTGGVGESE